MERFSMKEVIKQKYGESEKGIKGLLQPVPLLLNVLLKK